MELYDNYCKKCQDATLHTISKFSRLKGIKLKCMLCGTESRYVNFNILEGGKKAKNGKRKRENLNNFGREVS